MPYVYRYEGISKKKEGKKECDPAAIWLGLIEMKLTVTVTQKHGYSWDPVSMV